MNSAERIRVYLAARDPELGGPIDTAGDGTELREVDLVVVLQMLDILASLLAARQSSPEDPVSKEYVLAKVEQRVMGR